MGIADCLYKGLSGCPLSRRYSCRNDHRMYDWMYYRVGLFEKDSVFKFIAGSGIDYTKGTESEFKKTTEFPAEPKTHQRKLSPRPQPVFRIFIRSEFCLPEIAGN